MQQIPHELYRPIILNLSPNHLANVAIASRALHYETTLALYCNVNLRDASIDRILSWANAVAHNSRLAEQVKSICLPSEVCGSRYTGNLSEVPEVQESLTKAFGAVFNLVSFLIRPCRDPAIVNNSRYSYLTFDCFKTCHFRLKSFRVFASSTLSEREGLLLFLSQQTEIEDWVACDPKMSNNVITQSMLPSSLLPKLSTFYMNYYNTHGLPLLKFASSRPLVWLSIENNRPDESRSLVEILEAAGGCRQTLLHFEYLSLQSIVYTKLANHISFISRTFPRLESLKYTRNFIGLVLMVRIIIMFAAGCIVLRPIGCS